MVSGLLLVQMAKQCGAPVFGTVSTEEKAALALEAGADEAILYTKYTKQDFETEVKRLTKGQGVNVVYDSVGKPPLKKSELPEASGTHGTLRAIQWTGHAIRSGYPQCQRLSLPDVP